MCWALDDNQESCGSYNPTLCLFTGSTDDTIEVVENFFAKQSIPGAVAHHTWQDFGHNRNLCIKVGQLVGQLVMRAVGHNTLGTLAQPKSGFLADLEEGCGTPTWLCSVF